MHFRFYFILQREKLLQISGSKARLSQSFKARVKEVVEAFFPPKLLVSMVDAMVIFAFLFHFCCKDNPSFPAVSNLAFTIVSGFQTY